MPHERRSSGGFLDFRPAGRTRHAGSDDSDGYANRPAGAGRANPDMGRGIFRVRPGDRGRPGPPRFSRCRPSDRRPARPGRRRPGCAKSSRRWPRPSSAAGAEQGATRRRPTSSTGSARLGLEPLFDGEYTQTHPRQGARHDDRPQRRGDAPRLRPRSSATMDHPGGPLRSPGHPRRQALPRRRRQRLGRRHDARGRPAASPGRRPPKRSIMFIGFDLEEAGLFGSRYFVAHPPVPLERVALFITADMIGRVAGRRLRRPCLRHRHRARPGPCGPGSSRPARAGA